MKIGVWPNLDKDRDLSFTQKIIEWLNANGCVPLVTERIANRLSAHSASNGNLFMTVPCEQFSDEAEFVIVLGGDGTVLSVSGIFAEHDIPILGVNLGNLGYLTDVDKNDAFNSLDKAVRGEYLLEKRMMLDAESGADRYTALNDICVTKGVFSKIVTLELSVNGEYIDTYRADGLIVSTPTGSTAYNLSAGGPILKPDAEMIAVTPICPHALYSRPWVISATDSVRVKISGESGGDCQILADGQSRRVLKPGDTVTICRSKNYTTIMKTSNLGFYEILRRKLYR